MPSLLALPLSLSRVRPAGGGVRPAGPTVLRVCQADVLGAAPLRQCKGRSGAGVKVEHNEQGGTTTC